MKLSTKKIWLSIIAFIFIISATFTMVSYVTQNNSMAFALDLEKTTVEWNGSKGVGLDYIDNNDGTISVFSKYAPIGNVFAHNLNPYKNIIKKNILFTTLDESYDSGNSGVTISAQFNFPSGHPLANETHKSYIGPRIHLLKNTFIVANADTDDPIRTEYYYKTDATSGNVNYESSDNNYSLEQGVPYVFYFSVDNVKDGDAVIAYNIYLKITSLDQENIYVDNVFQEVWTTESMTFDVSDVAYLAIHTGEDVNSTIEKFQEYPSSSSFKTYYTDELENDEDISYFWDSYGILNDKIEKKTTEKYATVQKDGDPFYTPDFDNRFTFKVSVDNYYKYFTSEKFTAYESGKETLHDAGAIYLGLGQRYSDYGFKLDYYRDKVTLSCALSTLGSASADYDFDCQKDYKVSLVIRDVRDSEGSLIYRLQIMDVVEIGNEANKITISLLSDYLVDYNVVDSEIFPKHFRMANGNGHYGIVKSNLCDSSEGCGFSISAIEPWKDVTIIDGENQTTNKLNTAKLNLPVGSGAGEFGGYICSADKQFYPAGQLVDISSCKDKSITFTAKYTQTIKIKDLNNNEILTCKSAGYYTLPDYEGTKVFVAYKTDDGKFYKAGDRVEINKDIIFTLIDAEIQILDGVDIRLSADEFGGVRFAMKILTADYTLLQQMDVNLQVLINGEIVQFSGAEENNYTFAYLIKTDITAQYFSNTTVEIAVDYESGVSALLNKSANLSEIANEIYTRNAIAIATGQSLYKKSDIQKLQKYLNLSAE